MIKVLAMTPFYLPTMGGIEVLVDSVSQRLVDHGVETVVITDTADGLPSFGIVNGARVYRFRLARAIMSGSPREPLEVLHEIRQVVDRERPDIVHLHSVTQAAAFYIDRLLPKMRFAAQLVVTQHGVLEPVDQMGVTRALLRRAQVLTGVSEAVLKSAVAFSGRTDSPLLIRNGISGVPALPREMPARHRLLCVGRLQREKGIDLAIDALAMVRSRGVDASLDLIGQGEDGREFAARADALGIADYVSFLGRRSQEAARQAIAEASLLLVPSRTREGFALVAAEAAMAGTPCIAADTGGLAETVEHGATGLVVPSEDADGLADAVCYLLNDSRQWRQMSANAVKRAADRFSLDRCVSDYAAVYRGVLNLK